MTTQTVIDDRYAIQQADSLIGQGGMGAVHIGVDTTSNVPVAIKLLKPDLLEQNPNMVERFRREGEALRALNHPNIVKMLTACQHEGNHYLVMEFVSGGSLYDILEETPKLTVRRAMYIALDLADALTRAHRLKILHRDIKPANVLIAEDGTPRLTDFGMARFIDNQITQEGAIVGTLAYLSPEALNGEDVDERSDIWAFGVMLYEMVTGQRPFGAEKVGMLVQEVLTHPTPDLELIDSSLPTALVDLIYRMLEKDRNARIPSVRLVGAELESILRGGTTSIQPTVKPDGLETGRFEAITPTPAPALSDGEATPANNLPAQPTAFVGRKAELKELARLLHDKDTRMITLLGPGGIGKTRLSLAAATAHLGDFEDGAWFVPLAPVDEVEYIAPTIAEHIDFTFGGADAPENELLNYLQEKSMLLILDNVEHLTAGADIIVSILQAAPNVKVLASSRQSLRLRAEHIVEVPSMILPGERDSVDAIAEYPVVRLFMQSARRVAPDFTLDAETAPVVAQICAIVGGLPLGVELAATWLEALSAAEIVDEIEESLDFLETDLRDVPERHRSIRAVFEYSWNLLGESERDVFMKLSVFRGGFERDAVRKVTGASLKTLTNLVNKSLLERLPTGRYLINKLLRQFAEEAFADHAESEATYAKHAQYYGNLMDKIRPMFYGKKEQQAVEAVEAEIENLRQAWRWAVDHQLWSDLDKQLHAIMLFYQARSMIQEALARFDELSQALDGAGLKQSKIYWRVRIRYGWLAGRLGNYERTFNETSQGLLFFKDSDHDHLECAYALNNMSYARMMQGQYDESIQYAKDAAAFGPIEEDPTVEILSIANWGYAEYLRGNYPEALRLYEDVNAKSVDFEYSPIGQAFYDNNRGEILRDMGQPQEALALFEKAHASFKSYKHLRGMAFTLSNKAGLSFQTSDYDDAETMFEEAYALYREIGDKPGIGHSLSALGNAAFYQRKFTEAKLFYQESLAIRREIGDQRGVADSLDDLARIALAVEDPAEAQRLYDESLDLRQSTGDRVGVGVAMGGMGLALIFLHDYEDAEQQLLDSLAIGEETGNQGIIGQAIAGLGAVNLYRGDLDAARDYFKRTLEIGVGTGFQNLMTFALVGMAAIISEREDKARALELAFIALKFPNGMITVTKDMAEELITRLSEELPADTVEKARASSQIAVLDTVARTVLAEG